jgi:penicillin-binding protein 1A
MVRALRINFVVMLRSDKVSAFIHRNRRLFTTAVIVVCLVMWGAVGASAWLLRDVVIGLPDNAALRDIGAMAQSTTVLDVHGRAAFTIYREQRIEVPLPRISPNLIDAILAVEDQRFYDHGGLDIVRVFGAALTNLREGRSVQGGSTLTQQLARQSFLTPEKTYRRKLKEAIVAARIEGQFGKDDILALYLNKVYFGDGLYGVEAASLGYFGKHASDVSVSEAALLAGLVKSPSTYAPTVDMERAMARRKIVLDAMRDMGAIDLAAHEEALNEPVRLNDTLRKEEAYGQHFKEEVRKQLVERYGWERVYQGGMKVFTTIDLELQKAAEQEVARGLEEIERRQLRSSRTDAASRGADDVLQAALVAMDPKTGEVRAMVGGRDFQTSKFNRATQAYRQPGSAFKPFVYATAIERGFSPATVLTNLDEPTATVDGDWVPEDDHSRGSSMTMRTALRTSSNRAAVRMIKEVGIPATVRYAERLGFTSLPGVPSLALGSGEVTLASMVAAYSSFANEGMLPTPTLILRVETRDGQVLHDGTAALQRAVSEATAFLMSNMMADVLTSGTAASARQFGFTLPAAGKTGTTNDYYDAWFVGYTPSLATGVWVGYDRPRTIMRNGYAAQLAVPMWARFMKTATEGHSRDWLKPPPTVTTATICRLSGKLASSNCRNVASYDSDGYLSFQSAAYTEYFIRGTEPTRYCDQHDAYEPPASRAVATTGTAVTPQPSHREPSLVPEQPVRTPESQTPVAVAEAPTAPSVPPLGRGVESDTAPAQKQPGFWGRLFGRR